MTMSVSRSLRCAALFAAACAGLALSRAADAQYTWISNSSGNWSSPGNWASSNVPPAGGGTSVGLTFLNTAAAAWTATNDLGNPFVLNSLTLNSSSGALATIAGSPLAFDGAGAAVTNNGVGNWAVSAPVALNTNLTASGNGPGSGSFTGGIGGSGALIVGSSLPPNNLTNIFTVGGGSTTANPYSGGTVINSGMLQVANLTATPLGTGPVTVNGGAFGSNFGTPNIPNNFILNSDLNIRNSAFMIISGVLSGPGGLNMRNIGNATQTPALLQLQNDNTYTGPTVLQETNLHTALGGVFGNSTLGAPRLLLNANGSILNTSRIEVQGGGVLIMDNTSVAKQRIGVGVPVTLMSGELQLQGNNTNSTPVAETFGNLNLIGNSVLTMVPNGGGSQLTIGSVSRPNRGALLFKSTNMGQGTGLSFGNFLFTTVPTMVGGGGAAGSTNIDIIPFAAGFVSASVLTAPPNATDLVTYGANGVRMLTGSEYAAAMGGNSTDNVRLASGSSNNANQTVNALVTEGPVTGTGNINITSGMWLSAPTVAAAQTMANNINFGTAEGHIYVAGLQASSLTVNGTISGSNGLTKDGGGTLFLNNIANNFSGPITINAGVISFADQAALGSSNQVGVTYNGNVFPAFQFTGTSASLSQNFSLYSGHFRMTTTAANSSLVLNGVISGIGGMQINASGAGASIRLTGNNTFMNGVRIFNGDLEFSSDANLGDPSGGIDLGTNTNNEGIRLLGNWTTSRPMHVSLSAQINTQANNAVMNGVISGTGAITKIGTGALALNADNTYTGALTVGTTTTPGGSLVVNGVTISNVTLINGKLGGDGRVGAITLNTDGVVAPGNSAGSLDALSMTWNGGGNMEFELGSPGTNQDLLSLVGALTKGTAGVYEFDFTALPGLQSGLYTLITFGSNSGFVQSDFTYVAPPEIAGQFVLTANSLQFQVVPEPAIVSVCGAIAMLSFKRRPRRRSAA
jgi:autotransporter-associated beta strand protein